MNGKKVLTDVAIRAAKPRDKGYKLADGTVGGLHLFISPSGGKLWRLAYRVQGKHKLLSIGAYGAGPATGISLSEARSKAAAALSLLRGGRDPAVEKKLEKAAGKVSAGNTFDVVADEFIAKIEREGLAERTLEKTRWLVSLARPSLGVRPIADIRPAEVLAVLKAVERRGRLETARRLRATLSRVFRYAVATTRAESDPAAPLVGALVAPKVKSRAAILDPAEFGGLLRAIDTYHGTPETVAALRLMALLFPRPGELRLAEWAEFDLDAAVWVIPGQRTKMRREHRVPLPPQAVTILRDLHEITGPDGLTFPSIRSRKRPISENTLNGALRRLGFTKDDATAHGFRATASTLLNESGRFRPDVIESALAHQDADTVRAAYNRAAYWRERVALAKWWADTLDTLRLGARVIPLRPEQNTGTLTA